MITYKLFTGEVLIWWIVYVTVAVFVWVVNVG